MSINFNRAERGMATSFWNDIVAALISEGIDQKRANDWVNDYAEFGPEIEYRAPGEVARDIIKERAMEAAQRRLERATAAWERLGQPGTDAEGEPCSSS